jgi:hypothetical protein
LTLRWRELAHRIVQRSASLGAMPGEFGRSLGIVVERRDLVIAFAHQPAGDIAAHPAEANKPDLHVRLLRQR